MGGYHDIQSLKNLALKILMILPVSQRKNKTKKQQQQKSMTLLKDHDKAGESEDDKSTRHCTCISSCARCLQNIFHSQAPSSPVAKQPDHVYL